MNKQEFQKALIEYTHKRVTAAGYSNKEHTVQMAYQMGILIGMLYDLADSDSYNYKKILYTLYPELKEKNKK
jgi:hypothetical protein